MKSINQAERRSAFLKFLLFFIITIGVIIITVFFSIQVPFAENKKMKQEITSYKTKESFAIQFAAQMTDPQLLLSRLGSGQNDSTELLNNQINNMLSQLSAFKTGDSAANVNDNIYSKTISALYDLQSAKYNLAKCGMLSQNQNDLFQENQRLQRRIDNANNFIRQLSNAAHQPVPEPF